MTSYGNFEMVAGRLIWREVRTFELSDTGCIYLCHKPGTDEHMVYKLTKVPDGQFFWAGLWNSCVITGPIPAVKKGEWEHLFNSIEQAISVMLDQKCAVWCSTFDKAFGRIEVPGHKE